MQCRVKIGCDKVGRPTVRRLLSLALVTGLVFTGLALTGALANDVVAQVDPNAKGAQPKSEASETPAGGAAKADTPDKSAGEPSAKDKAALDSAVNQAGPSNEPAGNGATKNDIPPAPQGKKETPNESDSAFKKLDTNHDDQLTLKEYERGFKDGLSPGKDFSELDTDEKKGFLSEAEFDAGFDSPWLIALVALGVLIVPMLIGNRLAKQLRMPAYGWKISLILFTLVASSVFAWSGQLKLGIDLSGGVNLIYQIDKKKTDALVETLGADAGDAKARMARLVNAIILRVNPGGQKAVVIRSYGEDQIEVIIPKISNAEIERVKKIITTGGFLELRITADSKNLPKLIRNDYDEILRRARDPQHPSIVKNARGEDVARWYPIDPDKLNLRPELMTRANAAGEIEVLMMLDDVVRGDQLSSAYRTTDDIGQPCVGFTMTTAGGVALGELTSSNLPEEGGNFKHLLGVVFDGRLTSAPSINSTISKTGIITGDFTKEDIALQVSVLNAGSLPAALDPIPVRQDTISPTMGKDMIAKGKLSIQISAVFVLVFMLVYYRFSGFVACLAVLMNLLIVVGMLKLVQAELTLPGLGGLVLTIGMAVDANVLIFERIREELDGGAALRMAIRNGFDKARTTILDANLTTLITGIVLWVIGTDQIKGFAVTLILGILASMFTAIFCARVLFDIGERHRWITKLTMTRILGRTKIDFVSKQQIAMGLSAVLILIGLVAVYDRGRSLLDIDFNGGSSVNILFDKGHTMDVAAVRERVAELPDASVSEVASQDTGIHEHYKIVTSLGSLVSIEKEFARRDKNQDGKLSLDEYIGDRGETVKQFATTRFKVLDKNNDGALSLSDTVSDSEFTITDVDVKHYWLEHIFHGQLRTNTMKYDALTSLEEAGDADLPAADVPSADKPAADLPDAKADEKTKQSSTAVPPGDQAYDAAAEPTYFVNASYQEPAKEKPAEEKPAETAGEANKKASPDDKVNPDDKVDAKADDAQPDSKKPADSDVPTTDVPTTGSPTTGQPFLEFKTSVKLSFTEPLEDHELQAEIEEMAEPFSEVKGKIKLALTPGDSQSQTQGSKTWTLNCSYDEATMKTILARVTEKLATSPVFPSSSSIGAQVADKMKEKSVYAMVISLIAIIAYIWFRFQKVAYGFAAVVALIHDVLITLGFLAISAYAASYLGPVAAVLQIDPFKISLPVVAAFLTIVGYSLNDTIVVFDRIREVKGKSPDLNDEIINNSINQTLSRTLITSLTTLIVVVILYISGGSGIHSFAFALVVGVVVGTYSSVFIASPVLLWLSKAGQPASPQKAKVAAGTRS